MENGEIRWVSKKWVKGKGRKWVSRGEKGDDSTGKVDEQLMGEDTDGNSD